MRHGLGQNELFPGMSTVPEGRTLTSWIAERCVDYIRFRRDPDLPFFLWCSFSKPHPPLDPPEPYYSMYLDSPIPKPVISSWCDSEDCPIAFRRFRERRSCDLLPPEVIHAARAAYYGLVTQIDYNMGRIFGALQEAGILKDTLILYASDHGEYLGDHLGCAKSFFHEVSARIPFVLRLPKDHHNDHANRVDNRLVTLADIYPTLVSAAGGIPDSSVYGQNLLDLINEKADSRKAVVALQGPPGDAQHLSITDGRWKYMYYPEGPSEQLFDLNSDPGELQDLCRNRIAHRKVIDRLQHLLMKELNERAPSYLKEGQLPRKAPGRDDLNVRRRQDFPGYSTEYKDKDTRH
jgi:arylsulfatase A-like enzyme